MVFYIKKELHHCGPDTSTLRIGPDLVMRVLDGRLQVIQKDMGRKTLDKFILHNYLSCHHSHHKFSLVFDIILN